MMFKPSLGIQAALKSSSDRGVVRHAVDGPRNVLLLLYDSCCCLCSCIALQLFSLLC